MIFQGAYENVDPRLCLMKVPAGVGIHTGHIQRTSACCIWTQGQIQPDLPGIVLSVQKWLSGLLLHCLYLFKHLFCPSPVMHLAYIV